MKLYAILLTSAFLTVGAGIAQADCAADLAGLEAEGSGGASSAASGNLIAKGGSTAPLEASGTAASGQDASDGSAMDDAATGSGAGNEIAKDGSTAPLEPAGQGAAVATSGQDVAAQQAGDPTAAQQAAEDGATGAAASTRAEALENARSSLAAGDEAACLEAVEQARRL